MKINTLEKLQDCIDQDMAWRKKELIDIKLLIHTQHNPTLCRAGLALLSAHFEGFIKQLANYYVVYVSCQHIAISDLRTNFAAIHSWKSFRRCSETDKIRVYKETIDSFLSDFQQPFCAKYTHDQPIIKTEGNPSSTVVRSIFEAIGLDYSPYETKSKYIDTDLLSNRHGIVHGERVQIPINDFDSTFTKIVEIMEQFSNQVMAAAINKDYLSPLKDSTNDS